MRIAITIVLITAFSLTVAAQSRAGENPLLLANAAAKANEVTIHPNPGKNYFNVKLELDKAQEVRMDLYDLLGNLRAEVLPKQLLEKGNYSVGLYVTNYKEGIYYLLVRYEDQVKVKRVIITK